MEGRRSGGAEANENYVRSIRAGTKVTVHDTSRVPILGRAMESDSCLEIDMSTVERDERIKADRVIERMIEKRAERHAAEEPPEIVGDQMQLGMPAPLPATRTSSSSSTAPVRQKPQKKTLGQLMEALEGKKNARRAGVLPRGPTSNSSVTRKEAPPAVQTAHKQEGLATPTLSVDELHQRLLFAKDDIVLIQGVLAEADRLPIAVLEREGQQFYAAVGNLSLHKSRADIRRAALLARRRWRSSSFDKQQERQEADLALSTDRQDPAAEDVNGTPDVAEHQSLEPLSGAKQESGADSSPNAVENVAGSATTGDDKNTSGVDPRDDRALDAPALADDRTTEDFQMDEAPEISAKLVAEGLGVDTAVLSASGGS